MANPPKFFNNLLIWPILRGDRTFQVYVVEPAQYEPNTHAEIFAAAINVFITAEPRLLDPFAKNRVPTDAVRFDLVTFPEAFLPAERLLEILTYINRLDSFGCVHVGLRPSHIEANHLFSAKELRKLVADLKQITGIALDDLRPFESWLHHQQDELRFNIGCLFALDKDRQVRVCLHPKMVHSKFEVSPLEENHMQEANLLTVVTLRPADKVFQTVTIQPLLCSDALHLDMDRGQSRPLEAMARDAECLGDNPPDHIDIVSVANCTRQVELSSSKGAFYRIWHQEFRDTFVRAASDAALSRHHFSTFVLANFRMISAADPGGLSGAFIPVPVGTSRFPNFVTVSCWGRPKDSNADNYWTTPDEDCVGKRTWSSRGYIAALDPYGDKADTIARMFGFAIHRLPRDMSPWRANAGLTRCTLKNGEYSGQPLALAFSS